MDISPKHKQAIAQLIPAKDQQAFIDEVLEKALREKQKNAGSFVEVYVDGGSRGNPGPAGGGFAIFQDGHVVKKGAVYFGVQTNNRAEYLALREALRHTKALLPDQPVRCFMDSELVVKQMRGEYRVKHESLKPIYEEVRRIADQFSHFEIHHIPREQNKLADSLANDAMDKGA